MDEEKNISIGMRVVNKVTEFITAAFLPFINVLAAAGILKGLVMVVAVVGLLPDTSDTYVILVAVSNACFYFLPVYLAMNIAKYFDCNVYVNALIALSLVSPDMMKLIHKDGGLTFLSLPVMSIDYGLLLFPILLAIIASCYLEKGLNSFMPELLQSFITPTLTLAIMVPIILLVFGPIGQIIGTSLTAGFTALYSFSAILCGIVLTPAYMLLCIFGLHWFLVPIMLNNIALTGWDPVMGMCSIPPWVCLGIAIALIVKSKTQASRSRSIGAAFPAVFGIMEPTLFGVLIPLKKPLIMAAIIEMIAGIFIGIAGSEACGFAPPGPSSTTLFITHGALPLLGIGVISMIVGFVGMMFLNYSEFPEVKEDSKA